jgi:hypothetical protein
MVRARCCAVTVARHAGNVIASMFESLTCLKRIRYDATESNDGAISARAMHGGATRTPTKCCRKVFDV